MNTDTIKIIALLPSDKHRNTRVITDKQFFEEAKLHGKVLTLDEFEKMWNSDEIRVTDWFLRVLEVSKDSFRLV